MNVIYFALDHDILCVVMRTHQIDHEQKIMVSYRYVTISVLSNHLVMVTRVLPI